MMRYGIAAMSVALFLASAVALAGDVADTPHNLSTSGPGAVRSPSETEVCVFCHTPHNSAPRAPLWNRRDPGGTYTPYHSSTLKADPGQPTGSSRLCLSCHDGTIALGELLSRRSPVEVRGGPFLTGRARTGLDLSDDHPVSFRYADSLEPSGPDLVAKPQIRDRSALDAEGRMQCTSCHDPHDNAFGDFLRTDPRYGALCLACHAPAGWGGSSHATSTSGWNGSGSDPWPGSRDRTVAENACGSCHVSHDAPSRDRLLRDPGGEGCLTCHEGTVARADIGADMKKASAHGGGTGRGSHDPVEVPDGRSDHVECVDCHDPHRTTSEPAVAGGLPGSLRGAKGLSIDGTPLAEARQEFEICLSCHSDDSASTPDRVPRVVRQADVRRSFLPTNPSFHPVASPGRNQEVPSLLPPWSEGSRVGCTDCHGSDSSPAAGGTGPKGPHGSLWAPLLERRYDVADPSTESPVAYALCYKCHDRQSILSDRSFPTHRLHVSGEEASCSVCHDAHGIDGTAGSSENHSHLLNFDTRVVKPNSAGRLEFIDQGVRRGTCNLMCHGEDHVDEKY